MSRRKYMQTTFPPELASGARIGGKFVGPYTGTMRIWSGRPPILTTGDDLEPATLVLSMHGPNVGNSVTITFEGGNAWGGITKREFQIGNGISAELQAGQFAHVSVKAITQLKEGEELFFSWTYDPVNRSDLYQYSSYDITGLGSKKALATVTVLATVLAADKIDIGGNDASGGAPQAITAVNAGAVGGSGNFNVQDGFGVALSLEQVAANMVVAINGLANLQGTGGVEAIAPLLPATGTVITLECATGGVAGNAKTLTTSIPARLQITTGFAGGANNQINLPEGCKTIIPESASNIVFEIPQFSTTFTQSALAGEEIPAIWGSISSNVTQNIIFRLRGV